MKPFAALGALWLATAAAGAQPADFITDDNWISMGGLPGVDGRVQAAAADDSGNLYIGGEFSIAGNRIVNGIAKWDGNEWTALGSGLNGNVKALAVSGNEVYAGGGFTWATNLTGEAIQVNHVAKWNGTQWSTLGTGMSHVVNALVLSGAHLYAGGAFTNAGGVPAHNVARWNGSDWSALGSGVSLSFGTSSVRALAASGTNVYAAGLFDTAGGSPARLVAKWDGQTWLGLGYDGIVVVNALTMSGEDLYAGGGGVMKWDGSSWSPVGAAGEYLGVFSLAAAGSDLYVGGGFIVATNTGGDAVVVNRIARWDGTNWNALGGGVSREVQAIAVIGSSIYAGGYFTSAADGDGTTRRVSGVAHWDGSHWLPLGDGLTDGVSAMAMANGELYAGGAFNWADGNEANHVSKWIGVGWSPLGSGLNSRVSALAFNGTNLYTGGSFTTAGGMPANRIAQWDGNAWSALGSGMNDTILCLTKFGGELVAGGGFTNAGGIAANRIARWNGTHWSTLGSGFDGFVNALATSGGDLFAGGSFTTADGAPANNVARWDGTNWAALGQGLGSGGWLAQVNALAVSDGVLYAGGSFSSSFGTPPGYIARWNGTNWSPLGSGMSTGSGSTDYPHVYSLAISGDSLYAGGSFTMAGGLPAKYIANWDGTNWSSLGSGFSGNPEFLTTPGPRITALVASGDTLYAGGYFTLAGGKPSAYVAKAFLRGLPLTFDNPHLSNAVLHTTLTGPATATVVLEGSSNLTQWIPVATNTLSSNSWQLALPVNESNRELYRARLEP